MSAVSLLNSVLGPVMRGPSSSHAAAPYAIARTVRELSTSEGGVLQKVDVVFDPGGSFARVYKAQGSDEGFAAGMLGLEIDSEDYRQALKRLKSASRPFDFSLRIDKLADCDHPNRVDLHVRCTAPHGRERRDTYQAVSMGGGTFEIRSLNGIPLGINGDTGVLVVERNLESSDVATASLKEHLTAFPNLLVDARLPLNRAIVAKTRRPLSEEEKGVLHAALPHPLLLREAHPRQFPILGNPSPFPSAEDTVNQAKDRSLPRIAETFEAGLMGVSEGKVRDLFTHRFGQLLSSVQRGFALSKTGASMKYLGSSADAIRSSTLAIEVVGPQVQAAMSAALAIMELNTNRGVIAAAPTAGSAGILPGCLFSLRERGFGPDTLVDALEVMALVGGVILTRATFAAELSGCGAETGSAAAMAAAGIAHAYGATSEQVFDSASLCIMNTLGLICDPVHGEVEIPCHARNVAGVAHAFAAAAAMLGGFRAVLPFDEVADALLAVGSGMPAEFLCTARGGLAVTPTARKMPSPDRVLPVL